MDLELIKDGTILLSGKHTVDNETIKGVYLVNFENKTVIDGISYENPTRLIQNYLKTYTIDKYEIGQYIESLDEQLKFDNINLLESLQIEATKSPIISAFGLVSFTVLVTTFIVILYRRRTPKLTPEQHLNQRAGRLEMLVRQYEAAGRAS